MKPIHSRNCKQVVFINSTKGILSTRVPNSLFLAVPLGSARYLIFTCPCPINFYFFEYDWSETKDITESPTMIYCISLCFRRIKHNQVIVNNDDTSVQVPPTFLIK